MANNELLVKRIIIRVDGLEEDWEEVLEVLAGIEEEGEIDDSFEEIEDDEESEDCNLE